MKVYPSTRSSAPRGLNDSRSTGAQPMKPSSGSRAQPNGQRK